MSGDFSRAKREKVKWLVWLYLGTIRECVVCAVFWLYVWFHG